MASSEGMHLGNGSTRANIKHAVHKSGKGAKKRKDCQEFYKKMLNGSASHKFRSVSKLI